VNARVASPESCTHVTVFSRLELVTITRTIAILSRPGDRPALAISWFRGRSLVTRLLWHADALEPLERALTAQESGVCGSTVSDRGEVRVVVAVRVQGDDRAIGIWRELVETSAPLGRTTWIRASEVELLRVAIAELRKRSFPFGGAARHP